MFRSAGARRIFWRGRAFYKHLAPLGRSNNDARCTSSLSPPILICELRQFTRQLAPYNGPLTTDNGLDPNQLLQT